MLLQIVQPSVGAETIPVQMEKRNHFRVTYVTRNSASVGLESVPNRTHVLLRTLSVTVGVGVGAGEVGVGRLVGLVVAPRLKDPANQGGWQPKANHNFSLLIWFVQILPGFKRFIDRSYYVFSSITFTMYYDWERDYLRLSSRRRP
jgi:hypothetical protein